jgi:hypothetical protein
MFDGKAQFLTETGKFFKETKKTGKKIRADARDFMAALEDLKSIVETDEENPLPLQNANTQDVSGQSSASSEHTSSNTPKGR